MILTILLKRLGIIAAVVIAALLFFHFISLKSALRFRREENMHLKKQLANNQATLKELTRSVKEKEEDVTALKEELTEYMYPARLKKALRAAQETVAEMSAQLQLLEQEKEVLSEDNLYMRARLENNSKEITALLSEVKAAKEEAAALKKNLAHISTDSRVKQLEKAVKKKDAALAAMREELETLSTQITAAQDKYVALSEEKDSIHSELTATLKKNQELDSLNNRLQRQLFELSAELELKTKTVEELKAELTKPNVALNEEVESLRGRLFMHKDRLERVTLLYENLKRQLKEIAAMLSDKETAIAGKDTEIEALREEVAYLRLQLSSLDATYRQSRENQRMVVERLAEVTRLNRALQEELSDVSGIIGPQMKFAPLDQPSQMPDEQFMPQKTEPSVQPAKVPPASSVDELKKRVEVILQPSR